MAQAVGWTVRDGVAVVSVDNPPVNALGHAVRRGLVDAIAVAEADSRVRAVVIAAAGRTFPAGADIREFGKPPEDPWLPEVCDRIEACSKPVIAALHGTALGGGFEVALAAHYRIALASARVGLPEVTLGILPGAGGTQRTPRLIGAEQALRLMLTGKPIGAAEAMAMGLIDGVVEDDLLEQAVALAVMLADEGKGPRPTRDRRDGMRDPVAYEAAIKAARDGLKAPRLPAPGRIIDCVEAALLLPFDNGLAFERAAFEDCVTSPESAGLRHAFFAERRAAKIPEAKETPRPVGHAGVIGGGLMGAGIAHVLLGAGLRVTLIERDRDALAGGLQRVAVMEEQAIARGKMTEKERDAQWARLFGALDVGALAEADLVIEAVYEDEALKAGIFRELDRVMRPGAVLATNTSYLDIDQLARVTSRPADVIGLHFFSPVPAMKLLEVVVGAQTAPDVVATGFELAKQLGKVAVRAGVCDGFIGNRILTAYRTAADFLLEDGATPYQVDAAMRAFGFPLGPYQVLDMTGLDISWARRQRLAGTRDPRARYVAIGDRLCEAGWFGRKSGRGYYRYDAAGSASEDPEVLALIAAEREAKGIVARTIGDDEIRDRCLCAMVNEGARLLGEGIALRPSDIDVVMLAGYGYPRWRGGPMQTADQRGMLQIRNLLADYVGEDPIFWAPAAIFEEMIKYGRKFSDMDEG
ncbi:3-hydroxyacyl-CoA dehydrogenase NAD-binding domain-containing protein [Acidimangrovimonas pyrenivorans]|uniref:3-hydroxyacyl-CoA dehydrogenase NAD-binding domain-containing protein n=1 Tax=Acidimangrovimonas pyrenivorans TaxID=2030798 RepID=A0ABV7AI06_9RHOB